METKTQSIVHYSASLDLTKDEKEAQRLAKLTLAAMLFEFGRRVERDDSFSFPSQFTLSLDYETIGWDARFVMTLKKVE